MDHFLENLDPERFQQLCQALLVKEFPGLTCLPVAQPDGGRDALRRQGEAQLGKFAVYQVKFSRKSSSGEEARRWILEMAEGEVEKVEKLIERGANQYIFITNVAGTAHLDSGSMDRLHTELSSKIGLPVQCWWRDDLNRRLDGNWDLKFRYPEILTGSDFLRLLLEQTSGQEQQRRQSAICAFLADQYAEDVEVKFKQIELHNKLLDLFVDLPFKLIIRADEAKFRELAASFRSLNLSSSFETGTYVLGDAGSEIGGTATLLLGDVAADKLGQVIVEGAPGQGKSTLAQYICQVQRIKWLDKTLDMEKLPEHHRRFSLKFPIKVDLRDFASWLSGGNPFDPNTKLVITDPRSLETFLAYLIQYKSGGIEFSPNDLLEIARLTPLLVVLDGLDEVADLKGRAEVVAAVSKAAQRLRENCPAMKLIVTSRPAAFANSPGFDTQSFPHVELGAVRPSQIQAYAQRWMQVQGLDNKEKAEFQSVLNEKMEQPHIKDLARNPMQLAILLSLIHSRGPALPDKRTHLYDTYVDLFFSREAGKSLVVRRRLDLLKDIHRYLAWILHSEAETGKGKASGRIETDELKELLRKYLDRERHDTAVIEEIFGAMLERVVMIVSRIQGTYEFEVQPLREYFAARYLYDTAPYSPPGGEANGTKPDRFDAIARNFYWLNVTRFFCGCFSKGELLDLADRVKELALDPVLGRTRHPATLAAMLSSDWVFAQAPRAIAEVAAALSTPEAIRRLLTLGYRGGDSIQIPADCGGAAVAESAFAMLENLNTRDDLAFRLAEFICSNLTSEAIDRRWMKSAVETLADKPMKWLWVGHQLGTLQRTSRDKILSKLGNTPLNDEIVCNLLSIGRQDCALTNITDAGNLVRQILDNIKWHRYVRYFEAPFYLLPEFLLLTRSWLSGRGVVIHESLLELAKKFDSIDFSEIDTQKMLPMGFEKAAHSVSHKFSSTIKATNNGVVIVPDLEEILEECRILFGERRAIVVSACSIAQLPRGRGGRRAAIPLLDRTRPLCNRLRFARSRAADNRWWSEQLHAVRTRDDRFLFYLTLWAWANNSVLSAMSDQISHSLDQVSADEWLEIVDTLQSFLNWSNVTRPRNDMATNWSPDLSSPRFALLIAFRDTRTFGRTVFLRHFAHKNVSDSSIAEFCQSSALDAAMDGALDWENALSIIASSYSCGAWSRIMRVSSDRSRRGTLPETVAQQILNAPSDYPVHLWELAEAGAAAKARRAIRAVGTIAKKDLWFSA